MSIVPDQIVNAVVARRPEWHRLSTRKVIDKALARYSPELVDQVAKAVAADLTVNSPGVIPYRCEAASKGLPAPLPSNSPAFAPGPRHCGRRECPCDHANTCFAGWIDDLSGKAWACGVCKPNLARIQSTPDLSPELRDELIRTRVAP